MSEHIDQRLADLFAKAGYVYTQETMNTRTNLLLERIHAFLEGRGNFSEAEILCFAVELGRTGAVDEVLQRGVNIDTTGINGATALHHAVFYGDTETTAHLVNRGASISICDVYGNTALDYTDDPVMISLLSGSSYEPEPSTCSTMWA